MNKSRPEPIGFSGHVLNMMRQCVLFHPMNKDTFDRTVAASQVWLYPENYSIFAQDAPFDHFFLLISGGVKLQRLAPNGDEKVIEIIRPGQTFAEAVLFMGGQRYPVSAVSVCASMVVAIEAQTYLAALKQSHELSLGLLAALSQRLHGMVNEVDRLTLHNATFRVVDYLLSLVTDTHAHHALVSLLAPKHVVASRLSMKPETLSRTLKDLSQRGLISLQGAQIELHDIASLRQLVKLDH